MYSRHQVYKACLLAAADGIDCMAFGNACGSSNKGQFKSAFYQDIAAKYGDRLKDLNTDDCWNLYIKVKG